MRRICTNRLPSPLRSTHVSYSRNTSGAPKVCGPQCVHCTTNFGGGAVHGTGNSGQIMRSQTRALARAYKGAYAYKEIYSHLTYGAPIVRGRHIATAAVPWAPTLLCLCGGGWHVRREHTRRDYHSNDPHVCVYFLPRIYTHTSLLTSYIPI